MKKRVSNIIAVAVGACFFIGFVWVAWWSNHQAGQPVRQQPNHNVEQKTGGAENHHGFWGESDLAVTIVTLLLAFIAAVQAGLFLRQLGIMKSSMDDTRDLAEAAKLSAEAAKAQVAVTRMGVIDLERAYLSATPADVHFERVGPNGQKPRSADPLEVVAVINVANTGRTAAFLREIFGEFTRISPTGERPDYGMGIHYPTDIAISAEKDETLTPYKFRCSVANDGKTLYFQGYVKYRDIFKNDHTSRFCMAVLLQNNFTEIKLQLAGNDNWRECD